MAFSLTFGGVKAAKAHHLLDRNLVHLRKRKGEHISHCTRCVHDGGLWTWRNNNNTTTTTNTNLCHLLEGNGLDLRLRLGLGLRFVAGHDIIGTAAPAIRRRAAVT
jgi:hypothetical protein